MIRISNLSYTYPEGTKAALNDVSLSIDEGEVVLLAGPTGSGKSTLIACMNGLAPHIYGGDITGDAIVGGFIPKNTLLREISKTVGTVFQNPDTQIFMPTVEEDVAFGCENLSMPVEETIARREEAIDVMGLSGARASGTASLSGGQKQRLAISSVYAMGPRIFLFDEPMADLDERGRGEFVAVLGALKKQGKTVFVAEHRYEDLLPLVDRVVFIEGGSIKPSIPGFGTKDDGIFKNDSPVPGPVSIHLEDVSFSYRKGEMALRDINFSVRKDEIVALLGDNGSGKSTLLRILAGILRPTSGEVNILGMKNPPLESLVGRVGIVYQNPDEQLFAQTVEEEIGFASRFLPVAIDTGKYLGLAGLTGRRKDHPQNLSRGQRQILALVSTVAMEPGILLLDEPVTGMDRLCRDTFFKTFFAEACKGKTVIFTTHDLSMMKFATRVMKQEKGKIISDEVR